MTFICLLGMYIMFMKIIIVAGTFDVLDRVDDRVEQVMIGLICNILFLMVFDMFYWRSCRQRIYPVLCCGEYGQEVQTWRDLVISTIDVNNGTEEEHNPDYDYYRL